MDLCLKRCLYLFSWISKVFSLPFPNVFVFQTCLGYAPYGSGAHSTRIGREFEDILLVISSLEAVSLLLDFVQLSLSCLLVRKDQRFLLCFLIFLSNPIHRMLHVLIIEFLLELRVLNSCSLLILWWCFLL